MAAQWAGSARLLMSAGVALRRCADMLATLDALERACTAGSKALLAQIRRQQARLLQTA